MSNSLLNNKAFNNIKVSNLQVDNQINTIQIEPIYFKLNYEEIDEHTTSEKISNERYHHIYDQIDISGNFTRHLDWISTQLKNVRTAHGTNIIRNIETGDYVIFIAMLTFTNGGDISNTIAQTNIYEYDILVCSGIFKNYTKVIYTVTTNETNNIYDRYYTFK